MLKKRERTEYQKQYYLKNREQIVQRKIDYYKDRPWLNHRYYAKQRCNDVKYIKYRWYGQRGIQMFLTPEEIEILYFRDHAKKMEYPSIDRIDNDGHYCFENCQFIEMADNRLKR